MAAASSTSSFRLDDRVVRPALNEIEGPDGVERVNPRAMDVLVALASRPDGIASKQGLLDAVWTDLFVGDEVLSTAIWELRKALGDSARSPRFIRTVPRRGYQLLTLPVPVEEPAAGPISTPSTLARPGLGLATRRWLVAAGVALGLAASVAVVVRLQSPAEVAPVRSVAVLPFEALGGETRDIALADGLTDTLITSLARLGQLRVVSRTTSASYRGSSLTVPEIAHQLGVDSVVEGTLARDGDRLVLNAQLIDARTENHLWAQTYERRFEHLLDLQVEVARSIGAAIGGELATPVPPVAAPGTDDTGSSSILLWRFRTGGEVWSSPAVDGDTVVFGSRDGVLYAVDLEDGSEKWRLPLGREITVAPVVEHGAVVVTTREGAVVAVEIASGRELWRHRLTTSVEAPPAIASGRVVAVDEQGVVTSLDLVSGRQLWQGQVQESSDGVAAAGDLVVASGWDAALTAFDAVDGAIRWRSPLANRGNQPPLVDRDLALVPVADGSLRALDLSDGHERWRIRVPAPARPVAWRDRVLVGGDSSSLVVVDRSTGDLLWRWDADGWVNPPTVDGDVVFASSRDGQLVGLDAWTGMVRWRVEMDTWITTSPVVVGEKVLVGSLDGSVYCLSIPSGNDAATVSRQREGFIVHPDIGPIEARDPDVVLDDPARTRPRVRWRVRADGPVAHRPAVTSDGVVVSGFQSILCLDPATGGERWQFRCGGPVGTRPVVAGDLVLVGARDHTLYAVDGATGAERWRVRTDGDVISAPVVDAGSTYFGSRDRFLYAVDVATGHERWRRQLDVIHASPVVAGDTVYVPSRGDRLWALATADGAIRWSAPTVDWAVADPVVADDEVVVGACDGTILAFDRETGVERWRGTVNAETWYTPLVVGDRLVLGSADGHVYALDLATGAESWRVATGNRVLSSMAGWRDLVLAGSSDRQLYAIEVATGKVAWRVRTSGSVSGPTVAGDAAVFGSLDGWVTMIDLAPDGSRG